MIPLPDLSKLDHAAKDALILELFALVSKLTERVAELEAKLSRPPKTPDNSSTPPSMSPKGGVTTSGRSVGGKKRRKGRKGAFRALNPAPDRIRDLRLHRALVVRGMSGRCASGGVRLMITSTFRRSRQW
jgi:Family of unknown function (DUF6444)